MTDPTPGTPTPPEVLRQRLDDLVNTLGSDIEAVVTDLPRALAGPVVTPVLEGVIAGVVQAHGRFVSQTAELTASLDQVPAVLSAAPVEHPRPAHPDPGDPGPGDPARQHPERADG